MRTEWSQLFSSLFRTEPAQATRAHIDWQAAPLWDILCFVGVVSLYDPDSIRPFMHVSSLAYLATRCMWSTGPSTTRWGPWSPLEQMRPARAPSESLVRSGAQLPRVEFLECSDASTFSVNVFTTTRGTGDRSMLAETVAATPSGGIVAVRFFSCLVGVHVMCGRKEGRFVGSQSGSPLREFPACTSRSMPRSLVKGPAAPTSEYK